MDEEARKIMKQVRYRGNPENFDLEKAKQAIARRPPAGPRKTTPKAITMPKTPTMTQQPVKPKPTLDPPKYLEQNAAKPSPQKNEPFHAISDLL
ncbi:hypothetical protein PGB90_003593 [Kerria lacca]